LVLINASVVVARKPFPIQALKSALFVLALLPFLRLAVGAFGLQWFGGLGTNPVELITRSTGTWTLVFLCVTLSVAGATAPHARALHVFLRDLPLFHVYLV
jgi:DMSO/TMAO reductase YedYZ heme-binding membrane subunit